MPKVVKELGPAEVRAISNRGLNAVGGVAGLHLLVNRNGARSWVLRVRIGGKRRDIGLGGYPTVGLAEARTRARQMREQIDAGIDPVAARREKREALVAGLTFRQAAEQFLAVKATELDTKQLNNWTSTISAYAFQVIGDLPVSDVELRHIVDVLTPIWTTKTETAKRLRGRIERILDWAKVSGHRTGENPARWRGNLDAVLPRPGAIAKTVHQPAMPYSEVPAFVRKLRGMDTISSAALQFVILTACRSGEVRGALWSEIDLDAALWVIPADRMKMRKDHRVPLCSAAVTLLREVQEMADGDLVFPGANGPLSDVALSSIPRRMGIKAVPHGFRSSFRDWAAEMAHAPREVAEAALAHVVRGVEGAYARSDLLDRRRDLMDAWGEYVAQTAEVVPIRGSR